MAMDPTTQANSHFESHSMEFSTSNQNSSGFDLLLFREITRIIITVMIIIGMFGLGCGVDFRRVWKHFKKPTGAIIGIVCQFRKYGYQKKFSLAWKRFFMFFYRKHQLSVGSVEQVTFLKKLSNSFCYKFQKVTTYRQNF